MKRSNCCQAPIVDETDVCSDCKEHCVIVDQNEYSTWSKAELKEEVEKQMAALIHIAGTCEDQGVAICIENVCEKLAWIADGVTEIPEHPFIDTSSNMHSKEVSKRISEGIEILLQEWERSISSQ